MVEVLVSVLIVATMFLSLYSGISYGFSSISLSRQRLRASQIVLEKLEMSRLCTWDQINSNGFLPTNFSAAYDPAVAVSNGGGGLIYTGTLQVLTPPNGIFANGYATNLRILSVGVNWTNHGVQHTASGQTYYSQYGLQNYIITNK